VTSDLKTESMRRVALMIPAGYMATRASRGALHFGQGDPTYFAVYSMTWPSLAGRPNC